MTKKHNTNYVKLFFFVLILLTAVFSCESNKNTELNDTGEKISVFSGKYGDFEIETMTDKSGKPIGIYIERYIGNNKTVRFPSEINSLPVISISKDVFDDPRKGFFYWKPVKSVIIPDSIYTIEDFTFSYREMTRLKLGKNVRNIGTCAFANNKLTSVIIPDSVTKIGDSAFEENKLTSVTIPGSVLEIDNFAFNENKLTRVIIDNGVKIIGYSAFSFNKLRNLIIPDSVIYIGEKAFWSNDLTRVTIGNGVTAIEYHTFSFNKLTSVTIPDNVTEICWYAFQYNELTSVIIGNGVTEIGDNAFSYNKLTSVTIPDNVTEIGWGAFQHNKLTSVIIGNGVTYIGAYAFDYDRKEEPDYIKNGINIKVDPLSINPVKSITIPCNVELYGKEGYMSFPNNFDAFYNENGKKAGTYVWDGKNWKEKK